jgi:hypothetical protein
VRSIFTYVIVRLQDCQLNVRYVAAESVHSATVPVRKLVPGLLTVGLSSSKSDAESVTLLAEFVQK